MKSEDILEGICIIYGKCTENEQLQSVYDNQIPGSSIMPFMEILPMIEGIDTEDQYNKLDSLFSKI